MARLQKISDMVKEVLEQHPEARNSDMVLYIKVCERINSDILKQPFWVALTSLKQYNLPSIESVGRCRRKIVEHHPELAGNGEVEGQRVLNEIEFRDYARQVNV